MKCQLTLFPQVRHLWRNVNPWQSILAMAKDIVWPVQIYEHCPCCWWVGPNQTQIGSKQHLDFGKTQLAIFWNSFEQGIKVVCTIANEQPCCSPVASSGGVVLTISKELTAFVHQNETVVFMAASTGWPFKENMLMKLRSDTHPHFWWLLHEQELLICAGKKPALLSSQNASEK